MENRRQETGNWKLANLRFSISGFRFPVFHSSPVWFRLRRVFATGRLASKVLLALLLDVADVFEL
jgi:hypothetical protein